MLIYNAITRAAIIILRTPVTFIVSLIALSFAITVGIILTITSDINILYLYFIFYILYFF